MLIGLYRLSIAVIFAITQARGNLRKHISKSKISLWIDNSETCTVTTIVDNFRYVQDGDQPCLISLT